MESKAPSPRYLSWVFICATLGLLTLLSQALPGKKNTDPSAPRFNSAGLLEFPRDYREWVFLSSGHGMTYGPTARQGDPLFDNVFVNPSAYRAFLATGQWPDNTMFVLEVRNAATKGSINRGGEFQSGVAAVEVEVKSRARFAETNGWGFFGFNESHLAAKLMPKTANCYGCHSANGAVDNTFVQFYPTLIDAAKAHKTYRESTEEASKASPEP